jgi:3-oxoacyl-[acyl-carrier protein] reductase
MGKLTGKVAVVTGASKGIGADIARGLAAEGAAVAVNYASSREGAEKVVDAITKAGGKAFAVHGDVSKLADVQRIFAETKQAFGGVNILVNNAGVIDFAPFEQFNEENFHRVFAANVLGLMLASREAVTYFGEDGGSIINVGSAVIDINPPSGVIYTATKGALNSITLTLAKELGPKKIRVNSLNPGLVDTEGTRTIGFIGADVEQYAVSQTPLGRVGQPEDITPVAVFLASEDSRWLTGEKLVVSGGLR